MKKKIMILGCTVVLALSAVACGAKSSTATTAVSQEEISEPAAKETEKKETDAPTALSSESGSDKDGEEESDGGYAELQAFAVEIQNAVAAKSMEQLSELLSFPTYVSIDGGIEIKTAEEFLALKPEVIFTDSLTAAIAKVDITSLEMVQAGIVMGDGTPNITFNETEDGYGITGINE